MLETWLPVGWGERAVKYLGKFIVRNILNYVLEVLSYFLVLIIVLSLFRIMTLLSRNAF
jgi:hypothetical protein